MIARVLVTIVDDDASIRTGLCNLLRATGYAVELANSAEDFLSTLPRAAPNCLITDIQMPGISGLELQAILRTLWPSLPIIVMTAFPEPAVRERALAEGALCFLGKPFEAQELLGCLEMAINHG